MYSRIALLTLALATASAFHVQVPRTHCRLVVLHETKQEVPMNKERAQYCAEHFGECSVEEMEQMRECEYSIA